MTRINVARCALGGILAGVVSWLLGILTGRIYLEGMRAALAARGAFVAMRPGVLVLSFVASLLLGLTLVFFYAAARPRFGPGPGTAIIVAVGLWLGGPLVSLMTFHGAGLYATRSLLLWGAVSLVEMILAALAGASVYREAGASSAEGD
jgi:hypothetical protein